MEILYNDNMWHLEKFSISDQSKPALVKLGNHDNDHNA